MSTEKGPTPAWEGDTALERELNAYLTRRFIWSGDDVPGDECLSEARDILRLVRAAGWTEPRTVAAPAAQTATVADEVAELRSLNERRRALFLALTATWAAGRFPRRPTPADVRALADADLATVAEWVDDAAPLSSTGVGGWPTTATVSLRPLPEALARILSQPPTGA